MSRLNTVNGAQFWKERIAKENYRLDAIDEARSHKGAHAYSEPGGPILPNWDKSEKSDMRSEVRSVAPSQARSEARSESRHSRAPSGRTGSEYRSSRQGSDDGRSVRTGVTSIRSSDRMSVAEFKIEELEYRLQQEKIARLKSENELEVLKRTTLEKAIASVKMGDTR